MKKAFFYGKLYTIKGRRALNAKEQKMEQKRTLEDVMNDLARALRDLNDTIDEINTGLREVLEIADGGQK